MEPHTQSKQENNHKQVCKPVKWENWQRVRSRSFTFVLFCQPFKKKQGTRKQETKKKKQETKKKQINKNKDCTPQGRSSGRELGLVILLLFLFCYVLFSQCRDANVNGCIVVTLPLQMCQAETVSACVREQSNNCTLRVSPSGKKWRYLP